MPASGLDRRIPSAVAHDNAELSTNQRWDTVATDAPACCQRRIAARTSAGVRLTSRRRASSSAISARTGGRWLTTVVGFHKWGASKNLSINSEAARLNVGVEKFTRIRPKSATNSARRRWARARSPRTVNERCTLLPRTGSNPTTTRTSHTPGLRSRIEPLPLAARDGSYACPSLTRGHPYS
jgi:hypothetical protein